MNSSARQNLNPLSLVHFISPSCIHIQIHLNEFCKEKVFYILQHTHTHKQKRFNVIFQEMIYLRAGTKYTQECVMRWRNDERKLTLVIEKEKKGYTIFIPCLFVQYRCCRIYVGRMYEKNKHQVNTSKLANTFYGYVFLTRVKLSVFPIHRCNVSGLAYLICLTLMPAYTS